MNDQYKDVLQKLIAFLKHERDYDGTMTMLDPDEILNKIIGLSSDLPDVVDMVLGERGDNSTR